MKLFTRIVAVAAALVLLSAAGIALVAMAQGYRLYAVKTGSMVPTYRPGDLIIDTPAGRTPPVGSVVTFRPASGGAGVTSHRVHARTSAGLQTKGDANRTPDVLPVAARNVVGEVVASVPRGGYVVVFFQQPAGIAATMTLALSVFLSWSLFFPGKPTDPDRASAVAAANLPAPAPA